MANTVAIVQARMGSTRLPGKVLMDLAGEPLLRWVVERVELAESVNRVVVATSDKDVDDPIANLCAAHGWDIYRGSERDVLDRYYQASKAFNSDIIVRVTADCPLIDPELVDLVVNTLLASPAADYASNVIEPRCYPRGLDVEAFTAEALAEAWRSDGSSWREHVTPFLYRNPDRFRLRSVGAEEDLSRHRWTVDTTEDLDTVRAIVAVVGDRRASWKEYARAVKDHPELSRINCEIRQKELT